MERGKLKQKEAEELLGISERQTKRLLSRYRKEGDTGVIHRLRGSVSNRRIWEETRGQIEFLVKGRYFDFGPTLAAEYLSEKHKISVSRETLRKWMIEWQLWKPKKRKVKHRQWRERRGCLWQRLFQISKESVSAGLRKGKVLIESRLDGSLRIRFRDSYLKFLEIDSERRARKVASTDPEASRSASRRIPGYFPTASSMNRNERSKNV